MASASTPLRSNSNKSHFQQTVCLTDWWLVKAENDLEGARMAVAGFSSRQRQAMRVISSAPILKRYDVFTLGTTDGICVILKGFMNKARTLENGFPSDVCNHFVFGFPPYWEEYAKKFVGKESPSKDISGVHLLKKQSPQAGTAAVGGKPYVECCEKDFASQGELVAKGMWNSKKTNSGAVQLPQTSRASPADKTHSRFLDAGSVKDWPEQVPETPNQDKSMRKVKTNSNTHKAKKKATKSLHKPSAADNQTDNVIAGKSSLSEKSRALDMETRRKLTYASKETPDRKNEKVTSASHQSSSFKRSRSGRILMPTLEFWRNQRPIYDADGEITGIEEGIHPQQPRKGSGSASVRKRKRR